LWEVHEGRLISHLMLYDWILSLSYELSLGFLYTTFLNMIIVKRYKCYGNFIIGSLLQTVGRLKSTLFCTDDY